MHRKVAALLLAATIAVSAGARHERVSQRRVETEDTIQVPDVPVGPIADPKPPLPPPAEPRQLPIHFGTGTAVTEATSWWHIARDYAWWAGGLGFAFLIFAGMVRPREGTQSLLEWLVFKLCTPLLWVHVVLMALASGISQGLQSIPVHARRHFRSMRPGSVASS